MNFTFALWIQEGELGWVKCRGKTIFLMVSDFTTIFPEDIFLLFFKNLFIGCILVVACGIFVASCGIVHCSTGLSSYGAWAQSAAAHGLRSVCASVVVVLGLSSCGAWAQYLWWVGLDTPCMWDLCSLTRNQIWTPCIARQFLVPGPAGKSLTLLIFKSYRTNVSLGIF